MKINTARTISFLYFPFLWISLVSTALYSALHYFVFHHLPFMRESVTNIVLPAVFVSAAYFIFYKEKLNVVPKLRDDITRAYILVLLLALPGPLILQFAVERLSIGSHAGVNYEDITEEDGVHQYQLKRPLQCDREVVGVFPRYHTSSNKNAPDDSHYEVFIVSLVRSAQNEKPLFWFGKKYEKVVKRDRSPDNERESVWESTIQRSIENFNVFSQSDSITLLEGNRRMDDYQYFQSAVAEVHNIQDNTLPILTEVEKRKPFGYTARAAFIAFGIGQALWALICVFLRISTLRLDEQVGLSLEEKFRMRGSELLKTFGWFLPKKGYTATPLIIDINIIIYFLLGFLGVSLGDPSGADLVPYGSNYTPLVLEGQVWRLLTAGFLHFGFIHILMNMMALGFSGFMLEQVLGTARFTILYLISLLGCSLTSLWWNHPGNSAGASGAIFGLLGAMLFYALFNIGDKSNRAMFVIIFLFFGMFTLITDMVGWSHSDVAGHLGGMVTGMLVAIFFIPAVKKAKEIGM